MAYADQEMSSRRILAIGFVALLHAGVGYALVTGLAYDAAKAVFDDTKLFDIVPEEPKPPEEPPPPPPKVDLPPPPKMTVPPPVVQTNIQSNNTAPAFTEKAVQAPPPPPRPVEAPPPPPRVAQRAALKSGSISNDDYPPSAQRNEESGTTKATYTVGPDGKVTSCNASGASSTLDAETCKLIIRRFRFKPALGADGQPMSETKSQTVTWRLEK